MKYQFDSRVVTLLQKSRWSNFRKKDITHERNILISEGYAVSSAASIFIKNFSELKISHLAYSGEGMTESYFSVALATDTIFPNRVKKDYERRCEEELCPIGVGFSEHLVYMISPSGKIFGGYDDLFCKIGDDTEGAFLNMFFTHKFDDF